MPRNSISDPTPLLYTRPTPLQLRLYTFSPFVTFRKKRNLISDTQKAKFNLRQPLHKFTKNNLRRPRPQTFAVLLHPQTHLQQRLQFKPEILSETKRILI